MFVFSLFLAACGGESTAPAPTPPVTAPVPKPTPPPPAAVNVGPDGPDTIAVPANVPKTTAELPTDAATLAAGEATYTAKGCGACHKFGAKLVGPDLIGVAERRSPPWIARMVLKPEVMIKDDPQAKKLYAEAMTPMANQSVPEAEILPLIAYMAAQKAP